MSRRPGFVLEVDKSTPPTLFWSGESFGLETLPEGSRVIYAPEPMKALEDPYQAIRHALLQPEGDRDPLPALLRPGMKLTIAFDDISIPLPQMASPDIRQRIIEAVLVMAADAGVDLGAEAVGILAAVRLVGVADRRRDGEAGRNRDAQAAHLRQPVALAAEEVLALARPLGGTPAEGVYALFRHGSSSPCCR